MKNADGEHSGYDHKVFQSRDIMFISQCVERERLEK